VPAEEVDAMRILILDDDPSRTGFLAAAAGRACPGAEVRHGPVDDRSTDRERPDLVVLVPGAADGPRTVERVRALAGRHPGLPIVLLSARDAAAPAVAALRAGAADYVVLGDGDGLAELTSAVARLAGREGLPPPRRPASGAGRHGGEALAGLVGRSPAMEHVRELVRTAARTEAHVLIEGETGTGKEVVARAVHALGGRAAGPFVPVNCAAVPETLAESEFFGHARGAFTGAIQERPGVLQLADRGTLFLDEVEDLPLALQAKLLRVVQDREVKPLGASAVRRVDVRIVAASNRDLWRMVEAGEFRRDLYYRLRVLGIQLPPLRQRREDLPVLIEHFIARFNRAHGTRFASPPAATLRPLLEHPWPGNVRELENVLESLLVLASASGADPAELLGRPDVPAAGLVVDERTRILRVLDEHRWNRQRAATALGISRVTLWRRMERHGIRDPFGAAARETA
jgi:DNA-binding NtrC family response regulator